MEPYYQDDFATIYHGDALDILPAVAADVVVSDPPYGIAYRQTIKTVRDYGAIVGDDSSDLAEWLIGSWHPRPIVLFGANHFPHALPVPGRWSCWDKRVVEAADRMLGSPFELVWSNGPDKAGFMYRIMHGGVVNADGAGTSRFHPTQKPLTLLRRVIADLAPSGIIADPFMGSGSTLRAAKDCGRKSIGIEIEERYCEIAAKRLAQEVLDFGGVA